MKKIKSLNVKWYGWIPDIPDKRDKKFTGMKMKSGTPISLPPKIDLSVNMVEVYNQGSLGSCTANATGGVFQYIQLKDDAVEDWTTNPSRLFLYYNSRLFQGTVNTDSGAYIRDSVKAVAKFGVVPEDEYPYVIKDFAKKPPTAIYNHAKDHRAIEYQRVEQTLTETKIALSEGNPVIFGFSVYDEFEGQTVAKTGILNLPTKNETLKGGHAVVIVGYDDETQRFLVRNSWGSDWGINGYFTMPYAYVIDGDLAADFWVIKKIT
jgi:C1A family cysteine protease